MSKTPNTPDPNALSIPTEYIGKPVRSPEVTKNPYDGLESITGCENEHLDIRAIADEVRNQQDRALGITVVTAEPITKGFPPSFRSSLQEMTNRKGVERFFVMDQNGIQSYMCHVKLPGAFQILGAFTPDIHDSLDNIRSSLGPMNERHTNTALNIINCPQNGLIFETGAGADYERMKAIDRQAKERNGVVICHDIPTAAARAAETELDGIPFIALPARSELLGPALRKSPRPKIITLKDTISSIPFGGMEQLIKTAKEVDAQKIVITQSLNVSANSNVYPQNMKPGDPIFFQTMMKLLMMNNPKLLLSKDPKTEFLKQVSGQKAYENCYLITMEFIRLYMIMLAQNIGLTNNCTYVVDDSVELDNDAAVLYLDNQFPEITPMFKEGEFNTLSVGPFGRFVTRTQGIPAGKLSLKCRQFSLELSKQPSNPNEVRPQPGQKITVLRENQLLREVSKKTVGEEKIDSKICLTASSGEALPDVSDSDYHEAATGGRRAILSLIFNDYGKLGLPYDKYPLIEKRIKRAY